MLKLVDGQFAARGQNGRDRATDTIDCRERAHARRHFHKALDTDSERMGAVLAYIAHLYKVEKRARSAPNFRRPQLPPHSKT